MSDYKAFVEEECSAWERLSKTWEVVRLNAPQPFLTRVKLMENWQEDHLQELALRKAAIKCYEIRHGTKNSTTDVDDSPNDDLLRNHKIVVDKMQLELVQNLSADTDMILGSRAGIYEENYQAFIQQGEGYFKRLYMALFGGLILIAPMLIMRLHTDLLTVVLTTSVFVVVVGIILASVMKDAEAKDILGAAAAYAAVLVVFVGQGTVPEQSAWSNGQIAGLTVGVMVGVSLIGGFLGNIWTYEKLGRDLGI